MVSSLLHLVGLRPRVYYTLTNFWGGGQGPLGPPPQYANGFYLGHDVMYYLYIEVECLSINLLLSRRCSILKNKITSIHHG